MYDIIIDPNPIEVVNPMIYGQFIEFIENCIDGGIYDKGSRLSDEKGIRQDVLEKVKQLNPPILRWPGGTYANVFHWMDSIGPLEQRKKRKNIIWGGVVDGSFGTAEFIEYCRAIGTEPMLCVNMASGTPEEAANWVEYCNGTEDTYFANLRRSHGYEEPFNVKYWCIGNESYAQPDLGKQHDVEVYIRDAWEFTKHMKLTDNNIKLIFVGDGNNSEWNGRVLDALNQVCDYLSLHFYASEGNKGEYGPFGDLNTILLKIGGAIRLIDKYPDKVEDFDRWYRFPPRQGKIKLCIDEWNIWPVENSTDDDRYGLKCTYNWRDALWTACMLNLLINNAGHIEIANLAQMVNVLAPIRADENGSYLQTTFYPLAYYRKFMGNRLLACKADIPKFNAGEAGMLPAISVAATLCEDCSVSLALVNILKDEAMQLNIAGGYKICEVIEISCESFDTRNTFESRDNVKVKSFKVTQPQSGYALPPATISLLKLR